MRKNVSVLQENAKKKAPFHAIFFEKTQKKLM